MLTTEVDDVVGALNCLLCDVVAEVKTLPIWRDLMDTTCPSDIKKAILREFFWDVSSYQWFTTRAGFKMIGSLRVDEMKLMRVLLLHKWEEVEHRLWAFECYRSLGGVKPMIESPASDLSQGAASIAAIWEWMADHLHPHAYLGAEYLFEKLTAVLTRELVPALVASQLDKVNWQFIADHEEEDEKHALLLEGLINSTAEQYPQADAHILRGFDCFRQVYPVPAWRSVYARAVDHKSTELV